MFNIGIDIGGTFTDLVAVNEHGVITLVKVASTPHDQTAGVLTGLEYLAQRLHLSRQEMLNRTERIVHGMTVATNALLQRTGARVGLLTTAGHRDVLEMREGLKPERYDLRLARAEALVPRYLRLGVLERIRADGHIETPLDEVSLTQAIDFFRQENVESVAICYLHAYRNAEHERISRDAVREALPDAYICLSSEVLPQIKEYERVSTTVVNAYVGPLIEGYLGRFQQQLQQAGFSGPLLIILSHGGVAPLEEAIRVASGTVLSGPAGGLAGARHVAGMIDTRDLISFDMGGTSTDIALVVDRQAMLATDRKIANERIALPSLDIVTLGAGGGSIAHTDAGGLLQVGPQSAGAVPGPACYGAGNSQATVTDASVVLGYLDPENFLGGDRQLDTSAAQYALQVLGEQLGIDTIRAAEGIHHVVNTHMAEGIRLATVRRGVDPRRFALLGFGGAAGLHVTALAPLLNLSRVVVPRVASVLSAWGMLTTELRYETMRSHVGDTASLDATSIRALYLQLADAAQTRMRQWFSGDIRCQYSADMRYGEQIFEIDVSLQNVDFDSPDLLSQIKQAFETRHEALYTYSLKEQEPILVNARVAAIGALPVPPAEPIIQSRTISTTQSAESVAATRYRKIYLGQWLDAPVYDFNTLGTDQQLTGPAVVEADTTTVLLRPGDHAVITQHGWLDIDINET